MVFEPPLKTKERILLVALELFNDKSSSFVTTNHIAKAMGISPGNLYYHYNNKEDIVRTIWLELSAKMDSIWENLVSDSPDEDLADYFFKLFKIFYTYRFFWIELTVLLEKDKELSRLYRERLARVLEKYYKVMDIWVEKGMVDKERFERDKHLILENTLFIGQFWINYCHIHKGYVEPDDMKEGLLRIYYQLYPYLSPRSAEIMEKKLEDFNKLPFDDI